jgi:hypothetical protein
MDLLKLRKLLVVVEETLTEADQTITPPLRKAAAAAVIKNPFAGRFVEDLSPLFDLGAQLGEILGNEAVKSLGAAPGQVKAYGKGAIVGFAGELEHCAAILHPKLGKPLREAVNGGKAIIPSSAKRGGPGTAIDVPLHFKDDEWAISYFDAMEVRVPDAPGPDEIVIAVVLTNAGRPLARIEGKRIG